MQQYALSLKQPWATLLVHGLKTIEVRRWATSRRGRILIHASRVSDDRDEAWAHVPQKLVEHTQYRGGIVGVGNLDDCLTYRSLEAFIRDQAHHLNEPTWFKPPVLYGFAFTQLAPLPYQRFPGWMRFFPVDLAVNELSVGEVDLPSDLTGERGEVS